MERGLIFDIQGHSVHDGPGCRTLVFLSGCPLKCTWCSNPEGQLLHPRLMVHKNKCNHTDHFCIKACPYHAIQTSENSPQLKFNRSICDSCDSMDCVKACINNALNVAGRTYTVDELMRVLKRDQDFWGSQGGVTFSGGEPLLQKEFISDILKQCRIHYINTCVETCAHTDTTFLMEILRFTDWMFIDIKHMDSSLHRKETGAGNELILKNIKTMASSGWTGRLVIRVPLIPGYNDTAENLQTTADFLNSLNLKEINILSLHPYGNSKYEQLGLEILHADRISSSRQDMLEVRQFFEARGLQCYIDSDTPF